MMKFVDAIIVREADATMNGNNPMNQLDRVVVTCLPNETPQETWKRYKTLVWAERYDDCVALYDNPDNFDDLLTYDVVRVLTV